MSTKLTINKIPMVESQSLQLVLAAAQVHEKISIYLSDSLKKKGYKFASPSVLNFLSTLECGINYGSEIARTLGVSRQMVAKIVKELCNANYLEQREGLGKQKEIVFTKTGELLMSDSRQILASIDKILDKEMGDIQLKTMVTNLESVQKLMIQLSGT
jgi:DNA-binding MarR family transcriptional regulator